MVFLWFHRESRLIDNFHYHIRNQRVKIHKYIESFKLIGGISFSEPYILYIYCRLKRRVYYRLFSLFIVVHFLFNRLYVLREKISCIIEIIFVVLVILKNSF